MKRASRMMANTNMSGSGPALPPDQEAMPRAGAPQSAVPHCVVSVWTGRARASRSRSAKYQPCGQEPGPQAQSSRGSPTLTEPVRSEPQARGLPGGRGQIGDGEKPPWRRGPAPFIPSGRLSGPTRAALSGPRREAPPAQR